MICSENCQGYLDGYTLNNTGGMWEGNFAMMISIFVYPNMQGMEYSDLCWYYQILFAKFWYLPSFTVLYIPRTNAHCLILPRFLLVWMLVELQAHPLDDNFRRH